MAASARLSRVVLLLRDVKQGLQFYRDGLGLPVESEGAAYARLAMGNGAALELTAAESEAHCSTGYSPFLTFEVADMDETVPRLLRLGAALDGAVRYQPYGKVAAVRSPDGHMVGLFERAGLPGDADVAVAAACAARAHLDASGAAVP